MNSSSGKRLVCLDIYLINVFGYRLTLLNVVFDLLSKRNHKHFYKQTEWEAEWKGREDSLDLKAIN